MMLVLRGKWDGGKNGNRETIYELIATDWVGAGEI